MFVSLTYLPFDCEISLDVQLNSSSNDYPLGILLTDPVVPKMWWWCHHHVFSGISCFWGSGAHQSMLSGTRWMRNLILHPTSSLDWNLSKITRRYVENTNKKVVFFLFFPKINKHYFIILTIILLFLLGGPFWVEISSNEFLQRLK